MSTDPNTTDRNTLTTAAAAGGRRRAGAGTPRRVVGGGEFGGGVSRESRQSNCHPNQLKLFLLEQFSPELTCARSDQWQLGLAASSADGLSQVDKEIHGNH